MMKDLPPPSPTPWFLGEDQLDPGEWGFDGIIWAPPDESAKEQERVSAGSENPFIAEPCMVASEVAEEDALHIVRCVNCHADLLAALKTAALVLAVAAISDESFRPAAEEAKAALARAEGKPS